MHNQTRMVNTRPKCIYFGIDYFVEQNWLIEVEFKDIKVLDTIFNRRIIRVNRLKLFTFLPSKILTKKSMN